jgi:hypothetical protein
MYDNRKFQETVINITYFCIEKYSHLQISSRKVNKMYLTYIEEPISSVIEKIKETEIYQECLFLLDFFIPKEIYYADYEYKTENRIVNEEEEEEVIIEFIKDNQIVYTCTKEELLENNYVETKYDFMICQMIENNVTFQKIFHKIPSEEDFEFRNLNDNILSAIVIPINKSENPLDIHFVTDDYYFWVEKNIINKSFLDYILKTYYYSVEIGDYQLQIITNDINIYNIKMYENEAFQILENGLEVFDFTYFDMPDLLENLDVSDLEEDYDMISLEENDSEKEKEVVKPDEFDEEVKEEVVTQEIVNEEVVTQEVVTQEVVTQEVVNEEIVTQEVVTQEIVNEEVVNEEVVTQEIVNEEVVNEEVVNEEVVNE